MKFEDYLSEVTIPQINRELQRQHIKAELVKGKGYFYFSGDDVDLAEEQGVYGVYRLNDLSLQQWVDEAKSRVVKKR